MPNHVECCTTPVLDWIAKNMPDVPINIMDQYYPDNLCDPDSAKYKERYSEIAWSPTEEEILRSCKYAKDLGLWGFILWEIPLDYNWIEIYSKEVYPMEEKRL